MFYSEFKFSTFSLKHKVGILSQYSEFNSWLLNNFFTLFTSAEYVYILAFVAQHWVSVDFYRRIPLNVDFSQLQHLAPNVDLLTSALGVKRLPWNVSIRDVNIGFFPNPDIEFKNPV